MALAQRLGRHTSLQGSCRLPQRVSRRQVKVVSYQFDVTVRPYTLRKGDTIDTITTKRGFTAKELKSINLGMDLDNISEGQTILLPSGRLSSRDSEILTGIGKVYRVYPVRGGESVDDIMGKRKITREELTALNPGIDLDKVKEGLLLKLPANKFTVREREMLMGSGILPPEFFQATKNPFVIGGSILMLVCGFVIAWQRFYDEDKAMEEEEA